MVTIIAEKRGTLSNGGAGRHPQLNRGPHRKRKKAAHIRAAFIGRPDSANPYVRSALLSEVVSANVIQRLPAQEIVSCSGGDTPKKITQAILQRSAKECDAKNSEAVVEQRSCLLPRSRTRFGMKLHVERKTNRASFCSRPDIHFRHLISSRALRAPIIAAVLISNAAPAADYELLSTVIVSRHGVRSPIAARLRWRASPLIRGRRGRFRPDI
ncbi:MAG: hypothetical protein ACJ8FA_08180 [Xanthobacteraceae bacterium]